jgi:hypothetical protein
MTSAPTGSQVSGENGGAGRRAAEPLGRGVGTVSAEEESIGVMLREHSGWPLKTQGFCSRGVDGM